MMNTTKEDKAGLQLVLLPGYAEFILEERLHEFVRTLYKISVGLDIPLLRYFSGMEECEIIKLSMDGNIALLTALRDNTFDNYIEQSTNNWLKNQLPVITKTDVIADDIGLINYTRKTAFRRFLADYTSDVNEKMQIVDEIDRCILRLESVLYKTYLSIQQEKLQESNEQLKKRENQLLEAQELGKIGSFEWDLTGKEKSTFTPEVFKIFEYEKTSTLEAFLNDVHPEDRLKLKEALERALIDGVFECEYRYVRNGKNKVLCSRGLVFFKNGIAIKMAGTVTDITEKANLIARLVEHEELSNQAQALTNTGNWKWTIEKDAIEWSDEMYRIYGLEPQLEEITFQKFLTFIDEEDRNRRVTEINEAIKTGVASDYIMRILTRDGNRKILKGKGRVLKDKEGKSIGMLGTCQDITYEYQLTQELSRKNEELVRKNRDLESFSFIASHDLQEPLRKIQTFSNRIVNEGAAVIPAHFMTYFEKISKASNRMQKMIEDFLVFYHSMNSVDDTEVVDLNGIVKDALVYLDDPIKSKNVSISIDNLPFVKGRRLRLTQMFRHLLSNAIKFGKKEAAVSVGISSKFYEMEDGQAYAVISITDNGIGFDQKYTDRIFELFQKLHGDDEYTGSGIGLSLCKKIIEDHGGWITVFSQPQQGATFNVFFPVEKQSS